VVAELLAVVGGDDDDGVAPFAAFAKRGKHPTEFGVDFADHAVVLRAHPPHTLLGARRFGVGQLHHGFVEAVSFVARRNRHVDSCWVIFPRPAAGRRVRRMRTQVREVREPRSAS